MAAMRLKDEANELFKAVKYEKAEALYQEGLKALKAGMLHPLLANLLLCHTCLTRPQLWDKAKAE